MGNSDKSHGPKWDIFLYHVILFVCMHFLFVKVVGVLPLSELGSHSYFEFIKDHFLSQGVNIYQSDLINQVSNIWKTVLIIHLIIEIIELLFPKKKKDSSTKEPSQAEWKEADTKEPPKKEKPKKAKGSGWIYLIIAALLEIVWATALKMDMLGGPVIIALIVSFDLLIKSVKRLGVGVAYAVFTGFGTVGMVIIDFLVFQETMSWMKILLIILLLIFIIGLKFSTEPSKGEEQ